MDRKEQKKVMLMSKAIDSEALKLAVSENKRKIAQTLASYYTKEELIGLSNGFGYSFSSELEKLGEYAKDE
jgi:hypothetical protein